MRRPISQFHRRLLLLATVLVMSSPIARAATPFVMKNTEVQALPASANGRSYVLYVALPDSYATSPARKYPVVYGCDGYWDFPLLAMNVGNARVDGQMPEVILVGIAYAGENPDVGALRAWDLTPDAGPAYIYGTGHAQEFLGVLAGEIIPFVERTYRVDASFRVLTGSSYGGLFALYALFERPGLFHGYVAPSPALWWNGEYILQRARTFAATRAALSARVYVSYASEESGSIVSSTIRFAQEMEKLSIPGVEFAAREIVGERHSSTKPESYNRGLRFACAKIAPSPSYFPDPGYSTTGTLMNLSTRGRVGSGSDVLIGGIVVQGLAPKRMLIRAAGPSLASFGVADALANPRFTVVNNDHVAVASNDDWGGSGSFQEASDLRQAFTVTSAFRFPDGSRDAAAVVTLAPGNYTIVVESVDGTSGIALVEAYDMSGG